MQSLRQFDKKSPKEDAVYFDFDDPKWYDWLYSEGFERMQRNEDSYTYREFGDSYEFNRYNYWYWVKCFNDWLFRIYVFRDAIICEKEYECGGFAGCRQYRPTETPIAKIWDDIVEYIKN